MYIDTETLATAIYFIVDNWYLTEGYKSLTGKPGRKLEFTDSEMIEALSAIASEVQISLKQIHPLWWKKYFNELQVLIKNRKIFQLLVPIQSANSRILSLMEIVH